jgi:hypothetical protein
MKALAAALLEVQKSLNAVKPDKRNPAYGGSSYVSLETLLNEVRPKLNDHGILLLQAPTVHEPSGQPVLTTLLIHAESGESIDHAMPLVMDKQNSQGLGSAISYARRYSLTALLAIAEADDDGNTASARQGGGPQPVSAPVRAAGSGQAGRTAAPSPPAPSTDQAVIDENRKLTAEILEIHAKLGRDIAASSAEIHKHRTRNALVDHHEWLVEALALAKRNERAGQFKPPTGAAA